MVERLGPSNVFVAIVEFDPADADVGLFAAPRPEALLPEYFSPDRLQRDIPGQAGVQFFFTENGRTFCVYAVIGSYRARLTLAPQANAVFARGSQSDTIQNPLAAPTSNHHADRHHPAQPVQSPRPSTVLPFRITTRATGIQPDAELRDVAVAGSDVWVVGDRANAAGPIEGCAWRSRAGGSWTSYRPDPDPGGVLNGVHATSAREVWAAGSPGKDGTGDRVLLTPLGLAALAYGIPHPRC